MFILVDKQNKIGYPGDDLMAVSKESGKSINTLRSWMKKGKWFENIDFILFEEKRIKGSRGGINSGNEKYFNK
jgi:hypothetical protein